MCSRTRWTGRCVSLSTLTSRCPVWWSTSCGWRGFLSTARPAASSYLWSYNSCGQDRRQWNWWAAGMRRWSDIMRLKYEAHAAICFPFRITFAFQTNKITVFFSWDLGYINLMSQYLVLGSFLYVKCAKMCQIVLPFKFFNHWSGVFFYRRKVFCITALWLFQGEWTPPALWTALQEWQTRVVKGSCNTLFGDQFSCILQEDAAALQRVHLRIEVLQCTSHTISGP